MNNDSIHPSSSPSRPPQAAEARRNYGSQSAAPTDDDYLVPKHNFAQPMYLDFPADQGNPVFLMLCLMGGSLDLSVVHHCMIDTCHSKLGLIIIGISQL